MANGIKRLGKSQQIPAFIGFKRKKAKAIKKALLFWSLVNIDQLIQLIHMAVDTKPFVKEPDPFAFIVTQTKTTSLIRKNRQLMRGILESISIEHIANMKETLLAHIPQDVRFLSVCKTLID